MRLGSGAGGARRVYPTRLTRELSSLKRRHVRQRYDMEDTSSCTQKISEYVCVSSVCNHVMCV